MTDEKRPLSEQIAVMERALDAQRSQRQLAMRSLSEPATAELLAEARALIAEVEDIAAMHRPGELLDAELLGITHGAALDSAGFIADSLGDGLAARSLYQRARQVYVAIDKPHLVAGVDDRLTDLRSKYGKSSDEDMTALIERLEEVEPGSNAHVRTLIALGDLCLGRNDHHQALVWLEQAEAILGDSPAGATRLMGDLVGAVSGMASDGASPLGAGLLHSLERRTLYRGLLLALEAAHRESDPETSARYAKRAAALDVEQPSQDVREDLKRAMRKLLGD